LSCFTSQAGCSKPSTRKEEKAKNLSKKVYVTGDTKKAGKILTATQATVAMQI
jgi:hypothetical protein